MSIREPTADRHSVLRMEDVRGRRVVNDNSILEVPADLGKILDVVALVVITALSEQSVVDNLVDVELI